MKKLLIIPLVLLLSSINAQDLLTGGKTFIDSVSFSESPVFRVTSKEYLNGKPKFDAFLLVKAKINGVYDIKGGLQESETFNIGKIDVYGTDNTQRLWMDLHQSQVRTMVKKETVNGTFTGYMEGDFWGGNNHYRLRHLWFDYKFLHVGQDWSFFGDKEIWPNVMDWDGPPSGIWIRQPMVKLFFKNKTGWKLETGIEISNPEITFSNDLDAQIEASYQNLPDFITTIKKTGEWGHLRLAGIVRDMKYKNQGEVESVTGFGAALSGIFHTRKNSKDMFQFQAVYGKGIGTYLVSFGGLNYDAAPDGNGNLKTIPAFGAWASYEYWISKTIHANVVLGFSDFNSHEISNYLINGPEPPYVATNSAITLRHEYVLLNLMYDPIPNLTFGIEYNLGKKLAQHNGTITTDTGVTSEEKKSRTASRISFGAFFNF